MLRSPAGETVDIEAAAKIFAEHGASIRDFIKFHARHGDDEDDLYHDFFLELARRPPGEEINNLKAYLYVAVAHFFINCRRSAARRQRHQKSYCRELRQRKSEICVNMKDPLDAIVMKEECMRMIASLRTVLPRHESETVIRRHFSGQSRSRVAAAMGIRPGTVSVNVSKGLKKIRGFLSLLEGEGTL